MNTKIILCVDDEKIVLTSFKSQLRLALGSEFTLETAESAEEAISIVDSALESNWDIPVIVSDQIMPGMKGDEFLRLVHKKSKDSLKILLTGQADADAVGNALNNANLFRYIAKPWHETDLVLAVKEAITSYYQSKTIEIQKRELDAYVLQLQEYNQALELRTQELYLAKEKAEESSRLKSAFLQNISHEVRTPLNAIVGFNQLIAKSTHAPEKLVKYAKLVAENSDKLIGIITDIVDMAMLQSRQLKTIIVEFDVLRLLKDLIAEYFPKAQAKNLALQFIANPLVPTFLIHSDYTIVKRIFKHLIDNAIKFTKEGSITITCNYPNKNIEVSITDTGPGIKPELQRIVFEPFWQIETSINRNHGGNGLGLALVKGYLEVLNGTISLVSEENKGSVFVVGLGDCRVGN